MAKLPSDDSISRRDFLRRLSAIGGAAALTAFLESCSIADDSTAVTLQPTTMSNLQKSTLTIPASTPTVSDEILAGETVPTPTTSATQVTDDGKTRVALVKTSNRSEGVRQAINLLGINPVAEKSVFLKPNFNSSDPAPGSTHPDVLATLVMTLKDMGARQITVGDRSGMGNTRQVMTQLGVFQLAKDLGFTPLVFDELLAEDWVMVERANSHWEQGFPFARPCLDAQALVQTCCLKTHRYGGHFTLSLKNSVGMVAKRLPTLDHDFMQELHSSPHQRRMIAEINSAYTPALIVMDGVEAFISGGPDIGKKVFPEVVLAGTDRIAMDAVGVALLRSHGCKTEAAEGRIFEQEQIARAVEMGLGIDSPERIEFLTEDKDSADLSTILQGVLVEG